MNKYPKFYHRKVPIKLYKTVVKSAMYGLECWVVNKKNGIEDK